MSKKLTPKFTKYFFYLFLIIYKIKFLSLSKENFSFFIYKIVINVSVSNIFLLTSLSKNLFHFFRKVLLNN